MSRPESLSDIEIEVTDFATVDVEKIAGDGSLLKAYATFMEAVQKAGGTVEIRYSSRAEFKRPPTLVEQVAQLKSAQAQWDMHKKYYEQMAEIGSCEYEYQQSHAKDWALAEGLPFPPEHTPISDFDAVIRGIDEVVS